MEKVKLMERVISVGGKGAQVTDGDYSEALYAAAAALENFSSSYARVQLEYYYAKKKDKVALEVLRASYTQENQEVKVRE